MFAFPSYWAVSSEAIMSWTGLFIVISFDAMNILGSTKTNELWNGVGVYWLSFVSVLNYDCEAMSLL